MKVAITVVKVLMLAALFIISNYNLHITNQDERTVFVDTYTVWITNTFYQIVDVTGYVVKFEWLPKNLEPLG